MSQPAGLSLATSRVSFRHVALFYADDEEFLAGTSAFVRDGLESDEPTLVVLSPRRIAALRAELAEDAERVFFADMADVGANPARIIPVWQDFVDRYAGHGFRLRGIGEPIWAERGPAELAECERHESLLNLAFADTPGLCLLCPYDCSGLDDAVLEEARRNHPFLVAEGVEEVSELCRSLEQVAAPFDEPLPAPPGRREWRIFSARTLTRLRGWVSGHALAQGLPPARAEELMLAAHEIAANSVRHGGGGGVCRVWVEPDRVVCEVSDKGMLDAPLAGRKRPVPGAREGYGLWLANQLCDLVQVRSSPTGSVVRLHKRKA